jgi:hypothetical protein
VFAKCQRVEQNEWNFEFGRSNRTWAGYAAAAFLNELGKGAIRWAKVNLSAIVGTKVAVAFWEWKKESDLGEIVGGW